MNNKILLIFCLICLFFQQKAISKTIKITNTTENYISIVLNKTNTFTLEPKQTDNYEFNDNKIQTICGRKKITFVAPDNNIFYYFFNSIPSELHVRTIYFGEIESYYVESINNY